MEFDRCEKIEHCFDLSTGDEKVEDLERLDIVLKSTEYRKNIQLKNATIEIMDDDGTYVYHMCILLYLLMLRIQLIY